MNSAQPLPPFSKAIKIYETKTQFSLFSNRSMNMFYQTIFEGLCGYTEYNQINHVSIILTTSPYEQNSLIQTGQSNR